MNFYRMGYEKALQSLGLEKTATSFGHRVSKGFKRLFSAQRRAPTSPAASAKKPLIDPKRYKKYSPEDAAAADAAFGGKALDRATVRKGTNLLLPLAPAAAVGGIGYMGMEANKANALRNGPPQQYTYYR